MPSTGTTPGYPEWFGERKQTRAERFVSQKERDSTPKCGTCTEVKKAHVPIVPQVAFSQVEYQPITRLRKVAGSLGFSLRNRGIRPHRKKRGNPRELNYCTGLHTHMPVLWVMDGPFPLNQSYSFSEFTFGIHSSPPFHSNFLLPPSWSLLHNCFWH